MGPRYRLHSLTAAAHSLCRLHCMLRRVRALAPVLEKPHHRGEGGVVQMIVAQVQMRHVRVLLQRLHQCEHLHAGWGGVGEHTCGAQCMLRIGMQAWRG